MNEADASVVLCVRNGEKTIERQLLALQNQRFDGQYEVIVVDNGSTDRTRAIVSAWSRSLPSMGRIRCRVIDASNRVGIPYARNEGIAACTAGLIAFCDADDEVDENWLQSFSRKHTDPCIMGGRIVPFGDESAAARRLFAPGLIETRYLPHVSGANFAVTATVAREIGGFDQSLPPYGFDDVDFSWRVQLAGYPIKYVDEAKVRFTVSSNATSIRKRFKLGEGRVFMAQRYPDYDSSDYTISLVVKVGAHHLKNLLYALLRNREMERSLLGLLVADAGRLVGAIKYRHGRMPEFRGLP